MQFKSILHLACITGLLLMVPLVAMQFTTEVIWVLSDFVFAAALIFGTGLMYLFIAQTSGKTSYRAAVGIGLGTAFLLMWINGAVGIIGNEDNPANLLYVAVLLVGFFGGIISRFRAGGMMYVMFAAALVQLLVPVIALLIWRPDFSSIDVKVFVLNTGFATLFIGSGLLFRNASLEAPTAR